MTKDRSEASPRQRSTNRRAAPEVVDKRRAARRFNALLEGTHEGTGRDGRTEKKRQRLLAELREGMARASRKPLKPIDVLLRVQALLDLGETPSAIRRACKAVRPVAPSEDLIEGLRTLHAAYRFSESAYSFVGIDVPTLRAAGIGGAGPGLKTASLRPAPARARRGGAA